MEAVLNVYRVLAIDVLDVVESTRSVGQVDSALTALEQYFRNNAEHIIDLLARRGE